MTFKELERLPVLKQWFEMFRSLTDLPFHLVDRNQNISRHFPEPPDRHEFCRLIQRLPEGRRRCYASACKAGIESARSVRPYIYPCHAGLMDIAVPVISQGACIGFLCSGRILMRRPTPDRLVRLSREWRELGGDAARMRRAFLAMPLMSSAKVRQIARFLQFAITYILDMEDKTAFLSRHLAKYDPVEKARELVRTRYADRLTLETVARHVGLSPSRFEHVFKKRAGTTFVRYVQQMRLEKARLMLAASPLRVTEIAQETGFASLAHFNRTFKAAEGLSPGRYRRQAQAADFIK